MHVCKHMNVELEMWSTMKDTFIMAEAITNKRQRYKGTDRKRPNVRIVSQFCNNVSQESIRVCCVLPTQL